MPIEARKSRGSAKVAGAGEGTLSCRALNRALLARQMLLDRAAMPAARALEHLVGMQAQSPIPPYFGLWTRIKDFRAGELSTLIEQRKAVRLSLMRSTIHLVTVEDALALRPVLQSVQERGFYTGSRHGPALKGVDMPALLKLSRKLVEEKPLTFTGLGKLLEQRFPGRPLDSLGYASRTHFAMIQVPPRGLWGRSGQPAHTTIEAWLGRSIAKDTSPDKMICRYIAAFGPASVGDAQVWSGLSKLGETFERLRPKLRVFRDESGRELFDLPEAPRPDPETPAPVRFLPEYDNVLLSYADRTRIVSDADRKRLMAGGGVLASTILVDGFVHGIWKISRRGKAAALVIKPFRSLRKKDIAALSKEGERLLDFAAAGAAERDIVFEAAT